MAASRINKLLYSMNNNRFSEGAAATYMSLEADRLREERGVFDGVNKGKDYIYCDRHFISAQLLTFAQILRNYITVL